MLLAVSAHAQKRRAVRHPSAPVVLPPQTIVLAPSKDNTLYENGTGALSNGAGVHVFAGSNAGGVRRRAVLSFNLAQIPRGSRVTRVSLKMRVSMSISASSVSLHALLADWGEGLSNAGLSNDGGGAPSQTNDVTWIHRFYPNVRWTTPGGDFVSAPDAPPTPVLTEVTWETAQMVTRVQQWVDEPATNFGWIVIGNESFTRSAQRFDSREAPPATRPSLTIEYTPPR